MMIARSGNTVALRHVDYAVEAEIVARLRERGATIIRESSTRCSDGVWSRGRFHMQPYLGCREFPAIVEPYTGDPGPLADESGNSGLMLHDIRYDAKGNEAVFFPARLEKVLLKSPEWRAL